MPILAPGQVLRSRAPTLLVENRLEAGDWRFRLTVVDDSGNESAPTDLVVRVAAPTPTRPDPVRPTDPLRPIDPRIVRPQPDRPIRPIRPLRPPG
jgi:hypothetical protein